MGSGLVWFESTERNSVRQGSVCPKKKKGKPCHPDDGIPTKQLPMMDSVPEHSTYRIVIYCKKIKSSKAFIVKGRSSIWYGKSRDRSLSPEELAGNWHRNGKNRSSWTKFSPITPIIPSRQTEPGHVTLTEKANS